MENKPLELRMYFFTVFSLDNISKGIQCGHAALEYARHFGNTGLFRDFVDNWKTWIILNGGTTSDKLVDNIYFGSLNQIEADIIHFNYGNRENYINFSYFREPDLNDALTSVCFICDERVFNRKDYPDFKQYFINGVYEKFGNTEGNRLVLSPEENLIEANPDEYSEWVKIIGGEKNVFLRNLIKDKKLA
jgi:hypothetical protein